MDKNVIIELGKLENPHEGLGQFSKHIALQLIQRAPTYNLKFLYLVKNKYFHLPTKNIIYKKLYKHYRYINRLGSENSLWHMLHQHSRYFPKKNVPMLLTIHDLNFLTLKKNNKIKKYTVDLQKKIDRAQYITTISQTTMNHILEYCNVKVPIEIIYNGIQLESPYNDYNDKFYNPFLFSIGRICAQKNFLTLIRLLAKINDYTLIIAGNDKHQYSKVLFEEAKKLGVIDRLIILTDISEAQKSWLYQHCHGFLFPSLCEGFGLPVIEAMRYGKPVFISDLPIFREIAADYAFYFPSFDPDVMRKTFENGLKNYQMEQNLSLKIKQHSLQYSWATAIEKYISIYRKFTNV